MGPLVVFVALAERVWAGEGFGWDAPIVAFLNALAPFSDEDIHIDPFVTASTLAVGTLTAVLVLALLARRQARAALFLIVAIGGAVLLGSLVKVVFQRPAIEGQAGEYSFPSGSATWAMATLVEVVLVARPSRWRRLLVLAGAAFLVGFGGVIAFEEWHYPSDVLAGWCLALAWVVVLWLVLLRPHAQVPPAASLHRPHPGPSERP